MIEFIKSSIGQSVIWTTVLVALSIVGYYVVLKFRDRSEDDRPGSTDMYSKFREMREQGEITETEFRTIKTSLGKGRSTEVGTSVGSSPGDGNPGSDESGESDSNGSPEFTG